MKKNKGFTLISKACNGFTIIEILATVTIMGILFTIGIVSYTSFNRKQMVVQSAKNIINTLRLAQSKALNGEKDTSVCGTVVATMKTLDAWYFEVSANSYEIYGKCLGLADEFGGKNFDLPTASPLSYSITQIGTSPLPPIRFIRFLPITGATNGRYTICITGFADAAYTYKISVEKMGEINEQGFTTTCP